MLSDFVKARGIKLGREKRLTEEQCLELRQKREQGALIKTLMKDYNLSKASVYRYLDGTKVRELSPVWLKKIVLTQTGKSAQLPF